ncbi:MAG TPA: DUF4011 domain-containing protein, partial [Chitinophagaceae bacterium]|nr:DUF4011 domain-containing protein [Chitinophagaceae bacterium]
MQETLRLRLEAARKELLDFSLRNPLLHYRRPATRGVSITGESADALYQLLVVQGRSLTFLPQPAVEQGALAMPAPSEEALHDTRLQTADSEAVLQKRLLHTFYAARTAVEETGVNILYLVLGQLEWYESDAGEEARRAPLVLVPVRLERSGAADRFRLVPTGEETGDNLTLQAKLKNDFGLRLPELPEEEDLSLAAYFDAVAAAVAGRRRWQVVRDSVELGFFSFGKFMIYNDLSSDTWPAGRQPADHPLIQNLLGAGFSDPRPSVPDDAFLDSEPAAHDLFQVVDADASQLLALLAVNEGRNLVIQGPPGTGKSQTITNIIAHAVGAGKKVLFVAEKLAALEVVKRRLDSVGLGEACLELHSHKSSKKELHAELRRVLDLGRPALQHLQSEVALLHSRRAELNEYCAAINADIAGSGLTAQQVIGRLLRIGRVLGDRTLPRIEAHHLRHWDGAVVQRAEALADRVQARLAESGMPGGSPFWGSGLRVLLPTGEATLVGLLQAGEEAVQALETEGARIAAVFGLPAPRHRTETLFLSEVAGQLAGAPSLEGVHVSAAAWLSEAGNLAKGLETGERLFALQQQYAGVFLPEAWEQPLLPVRAELLAHGGKWYRFLIGSYKKAVRTLQALCTGKLPSSNEERLQYVDALLEGRRLMTAFADQAPLGRELFRSRWNDAASDWPALRAVALYLEEVHRSVQGGRLPAEVLAYLEKYPDATVARQAHEALTRRLAAHGKGVQGVSEGLQLDEGRCFPGGLLHQPFTLQGETFRSWREGLPGLQPAIAWNNLKDLAEGEGLSVVTDLAEHWPEAVTGLKTAVQKSWYEYLLEEAFSARPPLRRFEGATHEEVIRQFRRLDGLNLQYNRARAALAHWERLPEPEGAGQMQVLRHEFNKRSRHLPVRRLMAEAGLAIQAVKPVFMMSPLSIANFLPPSALEFDLVIFDEASQVRPVEALGALMRGRQLVVVGDTKQLPPTSFFDTLTREEDEEEENITADMQSVLGLCDAQGAPQRMLRWHYRSRHQSLIALSNDEFYENRLVVFPSPGSKHRLGLVLHQLTGTYYDRGRTRTNPGEAGRVAEAVMEHARTHPALSLGVVAFSTAQRQAIQDALELRRQAAPELETFFRSSTAEPFFVKNLENVQGDERDVIFISVGYGRTEEGYLSQSFGPLNNEGGERRLNVLITRAKLRCEVFTNFSSEEIDLSKTASLGVRALKRFLQFA